MKDYRSEEKFCFFLEIINSISSLKNEEISFVLLIKLWTVCALSVKSIRSLGMKLNFRAIHHTPYEIVLCYDVLKDGF